MRPIVERLQDLHHRACGKASPDRRELARRLFWWELSSEWEVFLGASETYADVLGKDGLAEYRKHAAAEWAKMPARSPGQDRAEDFIERFRITHMMESLARQSGDIEELIAVMSKDLSVAYHFLQIAEEYEKAGRPEKALEWAERGVRAFPKHIDSRLTDFLAERYHRLERQTWREKALAHIRAVTARETGEARQKRFECKDAPDHSTLVRVFLWEKDVEAAWAKAMEGGCSESLWRELASKREKDHPEDALPLSTETDRADGGAKAHRGVPGGGPGFEKKCAISWCGSAARRTLTLPWRGSNRAQGEAQFHEAPGARDVALS